MPISQKQTTGLVAVCSIALGLIIGYLIAHPPDRHAIDSYRPPTNSSAKTIVMAGDIGCDKNTPKTDFSCRSEDTANLIASLNPDAVLTTGDNQYPSGTLQSFQEGYDKTWGKFKSITYPTPGNHEYNTPGASGYYDYFGERAGERGKGYYHYKLGDWLLVALNSEIDISSDSEQIKWLEKTLETNKTACSLAYWHKPRFSTGGHASDPAFDTVWRVLYNHGVDIIVNGHSHGYERYAPLNPDGNRDSEGGIVQFVSGMGGSGPQAFKSNLPTLASRQNHAFGVLHFSLYAKAARYSFVPTPSQQTFTDHGTIACH